MGRLRGILLAAILAAPSVAMGGNLVNATSGYVYYHHVGADMASHDAAVEDCIQHAVSLAAPWEPGGVVGASLMAIKVDSVLFRANLENCMVANGWEVVRVPDDEGKRIAALPQTEQAATLASWVGAPDLHGEVARRFEPLPTLWRELPPPHSPLLDRTPPLPLSVSAGRHDLSQTRAPALATRAPALATDATMLKPAPDDAVLPPDATVIVVRMLTSAPGHQVALWFARLDDAPDKHGALKLDLFEVASPVRLFWAKGPLLQHTFVVAVKPGRWRLLGPQGTSLCLGGPVFDVRPGEAIFAGSFDAAADDSLVPDTRLDVVKPTMHDQALGSRLAPAQWQNGQTSPCGLAWAVYLYKFDMPGAPRIEGAAGR